MAAAEARWEELYKNDIEQSWSRYLRNPFSRQTLWKWWKEVLNKTRWSSCGNKVPRKAAWFVSKGCSCTYRYSGTEWNPTSFPDWLTEITERVMRKVGWPSKVSTLPNSAM